MKKEEFAKIENESLSQIQEGMEALTRQLYKAHKILTTILYGLILEDSEDKENMKALTGGHGNEELANALPDILRKAVEEDGGQPFDIQKVKKTI